MIGSLLIANRGEIACRIIRTARAMGVRTVAVYSDADAKALHVRQADEAVHIGPSPAAESYLRGDRIIDAARATGAEAIHPGYGFLSENAEFAEAVTAAGLIWVGPKPESIRAMGPKDAAKKLMQDAGVPVTPGYMGEDQSPARLLAEAEAIGWPVLIKAVAGGGGKGMRKVDSAADFLPALESCRREAQASFANDVVLLEKWITAPRHIEVQVFGDSHGNVVHLFERDCSLQRRHQKVIEEAPAPGMHPETREQICAAAVRAARAVDYVGAGTIEFIADTGEGLSADRIFFMEMNTRLQVEHPVTEEITGVDLVEWQLRVASGEPLPKRQDELSINGWAMEARIYAEIPARGFVPSPGPVAHLQWGRDYHEEIHGRIETSVEPGDEITPHYDPMVAKIIRHGTTRQAALARLTATVVTTEIWPLQTNLAFVGKILCSDAFEDARVDTGYLERALPLLLEDVEAGPETWRQAALHVVNDTLRALPGPDLPLGFRLNAEPRFQAVLFHEGESRLVSDDVKMEPSTERFGDQVVVFTMGAAHSFTTRPEGGGAVTGAAGGAILAPMPGKVIAVDVAEGEAVSKGQRLLVLEAMKMEHALTAPFDGTVAELKAAVGGQVQVEALLARVEQRASG